jgi:hypothetical protein
LNHGSWDVRRICCHSVVTYEGFGCRFVPDHEAFEFRHRCTRVIGGASLLWKKPRN